MSALAAVRVATDADIHALVMAAYDGTWNEFTRDRVGGSTIRATKSAILSASGRVDCCLCARPMLSIDPEGRDMPEVNHLVPEVEFGGKGGWLMRASVLRMVGFAAMVVACRGCNVDNGDRIIWPSSLLHSDHFVTGCADKPAKVEGGDRYTRDRRERVGW